VIGELGDALRAAVTGGTFAALPLSLAAGLASSVSPCCVALYPAAAATCCVTRETRPILAIRAAFAFVLGIAVATSLLGVIAALAGRALVGAGPWASYGLAVIPLVLGLHFMGWLPLPAALTTVRAPAATRWGGAFVSGLLLSVVFIPCGTPMLAALMSFAAVRGSIPYGAGLLFLYGLGAGLPILPVGAFTSVAAGKLAQRGWRTTIDRITGACLLALGMYLIWAA
jgi:cytochrome c biogenesis protein CcdA